MKTPFKRERFRLVDGLVIAAIAMLALKVLGLITWISTPAEPEPGPNGLPAFGRVFAYARSNYLPPDVTTTGSVPEVNKEEPAKAPAKAEAPIAPSSPAPAPGVSASERAILERLGERREELLKKARDSDARERILDETQKRVDARLDELRYLADKVEPSAGMKPEASMDMDGIKNIVVMYETMKPKDAARVFERLPQNILVQVVQRMNPRKMADVLAAMNPVGAEKLTVALATRGREGANGSNAAANLPPGELPAFDAAPARR